MGVEVQYYGIDWLAMFLTLVGIYLIGDKNRFGFVTMMCGNASWIAVGYLTSSLAMAIANFVFLAMNTRALVKWSRDSSGKVLTRQYDHGPED